MFYTDFAKQFKRSGVIESIRSYGQVIEKLDEGKVLINGIETKFGSVEEARQYVKQDYISHQLAGKVSTETYEELSEEKLANIIKEHYDVKVTDTLIESYKELASSRVFSIDPVVLEIRSLNKLDRLIEGKLHYVLNDQSIVAISEATQDRLNKLLQGQQEVIEYMRESKDNFTYVLSKLEEN